jgi:PAS domain S-box-containing protein
MNKPILRGALLAILLTAVFILLDLITDRFAGNSPGLDWPHLILVVSILLISFVLLRRAAQAQRHAEVTLRQARDELDVRVKQRTAELESTHAALRQANQRFELTQAAAGAGSWDWDIPSGHQEWSAKMFELFGLDMRTTAASFEAWRSVLHPEDRETAERRIDQALKDRTDLANEYRIILPNGQIRWISALGSVLDDAQGRPARMAGICLDITDRKRAATDVERLSSFPRLNPNPVLEIDASGTITYRNAAATAALEKLAPENPCALLPDDLSTILEALDQRKELAFQREVQAGGATFAETVQVIPEFNAARIYALDITERIRTEEALRSTRLQVEAEKRHLEALLQALPVGVVITDAQGGVLLANGMDEQIWGPRPITHDVDGYVQYTAWWADSGKSVEPHEWASALAVLKGESVFEQVLEIQRFDGEHGFILNSAVPIRDEEGRIIGSAVAIQDITELRRAEQALRESEEKYRLLFQNMAEGFALYELLYDEQGEPADWRVLEVNDAYMRHTGMARDQIVGRRMSELFPTAIPEYLQRFATVVATQTSSVIETYAKAVGRHQRVFTFPAGDHRFASTIEDISGRKRSEQALREKEAELVDAQRIAHIGSWLWDAKTDAATGSAEMFRVFGLDPQSATMPAFRQQRGQYYPEEEWKRINAAVQRALETGAGYQLDVQAIRDGAPIWVTIRGEAVRDAHGQIAGMRGTVEDITERKQAENELYQREAELALASHQRVITEERQRLARELHDSVSQALYGISLGVNTALTLLDVDRNKVLEALDYSLAQTRAALTEMRALIFALRPEALATEGVVAALSKATAALIASRNVEIELSLCDEPDVSLEVKEVLYRIAQEALQNAVKHARCSRLHVSLTRERDRLSLEVHDNGVGFDPQAQYPGHLGLKSMRERAVSVGGRLDITSASGHGTQIRVRIPILSEEPA